MNKETPAECLKEVKGVAISLVIFVIAAIAHPCTNITGI